MGVLGTIFGASVAGDSQTDYDVTKFRDLNNPLDPQDMKTFEGMKALQLIDLKSQQIPLTEQEQGFLDGKKDGRESVQKNITSTVNNMLQSAQQSYKFEDGKATVSKETVKTEFARLLRNETSERLFEQPGLEELAPAPSQPTRTGKTGPSPAF